jgi:glutamate racemase
MPAPTSSSSPIPSPADAPIGVFDSGVGGLTILREIRAALPREDLVYVADAAHLPYGGKSLEFVRGRAFALADFLAGLRAKAIVVACNTATAAAIDALRERHAIPFVGVEPAVKPAAASSRSGVIGVLATPATLGSARYRSLVERFAQGRNVLAQPCTGLADHIEQGRLDDEATQALVRGFVAPLLDAGADTIVLGCTHYPLIAHIVRRIAGPGVEVIENGTAVARELSRQLEVRSVLRADGDGGAAFFASGNLGTVAPVIDRLWGKAEVAALPGKVSATPG